MLRELTGSSDLNKRRRISLGAKLNVLIVCVILAVSAVLMITSYSAYCRKVDEFCYGRCEEAAVTASKSGSSLIEDIWNAIDTDEFRQVREQTGSQSLRRI